MNKRIKLIAAALLFCALVVSAGVVLKKYSTAPAKVPEQGEKAPAGNTFTEAIARELDTVLQQLDVSPVFLEGNYELYDSASGKLIEKEPFKLYRDRGLLYTQTANIEQLSDGLHAAMINSSGRSVNFVPAKKDSSFSISRALSGLREYVNSSKSRVTVQTTGSLTTVTFVFDGNYQYSECGITYNKDDKKLQSSYTISKTIVPQEDEEKSVKLQLVLDRYDHTGSEADNNVLHKISWNSSDAVTVADSLKSYTLTQHK